MAGRRGAASGAAGAPVSVLAPVSLRAGRGWRVVTSSQEPQPRRDISNDEQTVRDGYRGRVLTALTWSASGEVGAQGLRFIFMIALARLLSPDEFGVMAMLMVI